MGQLDWINTEKEHTLTTLVKIQGLTIVLQFNKEL